MRTAHRFLMSNRDARTMHLRGSSRLGAFGVAALLCVPSMAVVLTPGASAAPPARRSTADRLLNAMTGARQQAGVLAAQAAAIEQEVKATTAKVVQRASKATRKAVAAGNVIQNITSGGPTTTVAPKAAVATAVGVAAIGTYGVAQLERTFVDTSRSTAANGSTAPRRNSRSIATTVFHPTGAPAGTRFPVLVFGHGFGASPARYADIVRPIASAGYVVVAPTFPLSNSATVGGPTLADEPQQPADMRFALDQVIALGTQAGNPLSGLLDGNRLAAAGHSLGGITTFDYAYGAGYDKRLRAAVPMSAILNVFSATRPFTNPMVPMLLIHGDADETVPYGLGSVTAFAAAPSPKALLTIRNGSHSFGLAGIPGSSPAVGSAVVQATVSFLDRYVKDDPTGINRLQALATGQPGLLRIDAAGL